MGIFENASNPKRHSPSIKLRMPLTAPNHHLKPCNIACNTVSRRGRILHSTVISRVHSSRWALNVWHNRRASWGPLWELIRVVDMRLWDAGHTNGEFETETRLVTFLRRGGGCVVGGKNWWWCTAYGTAGDAEGFGGVFFRGGCAVGANLTTSDAKFRVAENVGL